MTTSVSVGVATTPGARSSAEMLSQADLALYAAKGAGKGRWRRYEPGLHLAAVDRLEVRNELEHAIASGAFTLRYQPIVELCSGALVGVEALVRWRHPRRGLVPPGDFIHVAEETGLVVPLGSWVLDCALSRPRPLAPGGRARDVGHDERERLGPPGARTGLPEHAGGGARPVGGAGGVARTGDHGDGAARRGRPGHRGPVRPARARPAHRHRRLRHRLLVAGLPPAPRHRRPEDRPVLHQRDRELGPPGRAGRGDRAPRPGARPPGRRRGGGDRHAARRPAPGRLPVWGRGTSSRSRSRPTRSSPGCSPPLPDPGRHTPTSPADDDHRPARRSPAPEPGAPPARPTPVRAGAAAPVQPDAGRRDRRGAREAHPRRGALAGRLRVLQLPGVRPRPGDRRRDRRAGAGAGARTRAGRGCSATRGSTPRSRSS